MGAQDFEKRLRAGEVGDGDEVEVVVLEVDQLHGELARAALRPVVFRRVQFVGV